MSDTTLQLTAILITGAINLGLAILVYDATVRVIRFFVGR